MTTDAERECYYRLAQEAAQQGEVIELGAWLGASTAYIAAGYRDGGGEGAVQVYDHFVSKPGHLRKVKEFYSKRGIDRAPVGPSLEAFRENLGGLMAHVEAHQGPIEQIKWGGEHISLLVSDAPKRVPQISAVLTALRKGFGPGSIMAWQDFCHFPSYEIPACLYRIREYIEFVEAVVPGTTLVFRVKSQWSRSEVAMATLDLGGWTVDEVQSAWAYWERVVPDEKRALFVCGQAMFLCDIGCPTEAVVALSDAYWLGFRYNQPAMLKKWRYLRDARPDFLTRYAPLFDYLESQGVFETEAA